MEKNEKAEYFAQYYGQEVQKSRISLSEVILKCKPEYYFDEWYLELKPIPLITDEDAIEVARMQDWEYEGLSDLKSVLKVSVKNNWINYTTADFLRSKSYAIPFRNFSVEQLIEMGWMKLTT